MEQKVREVISKRTTVNLQYSFENSMFSKHVTFNNEEQLLKKQPCALFSSCSTVDSVLILFS